ncbi:MAG: YceI family protein [Actinomycetota bacterium]|nr:YceI family protein [Actinomycetota bacterium]
MLIATVRGRLTEFEGTLEVDESGSAHGRGTARAASIDTGDATRDEHLRSADFLDAESHPHLSFQSRAVESLGDGRFKVSGDLTIRGVTRPVEVEAKVHGTGRDPYGNERVALEVRGGINRTEFGLNWNRSLETGGVLVGERVELELDLSAVREAEQAAA